MVKQLILCSFLFLVFCDNPSSVTEGTNSIDGALIGSWEGVGITCTFNSDGSCIKSSASMTFYTDNAAIYFSNSEWCYYRVMGDNLSLSFFQINNSNKWRDYSLSRIE